ncbi:MAG: GRP family sugar transporter, partial [Candidatus Levyibacteriota bacterium]
WLYYSLFLAGIGSLSAPLTKRVSQSLHIALYFFVFNLISVGFILAIVLFTTGIPKVVPQFYFNIFMSALLDIIAFLAGTYAVKHYPISLLAPVTAFYPIFAAIISAFTLHEVPTPLKWVGILVIVIGAYLLDISEVKTSFLSPFKKLFSNKGVQLVLLEVFIFGITPTFQKQAIFQTHPVSPLYVSLMGNILVTIFMGVYGLRYFTKEKTHIKSNFPLFLLLGLLNALGQYAAYMAFALTNVSYSIAISQLSILLTILWGGIFFKEKKIKERLLGSFVMIAGVILLVV